MNIGSSLLPAAIRRRYAAKFIISLLFVFVVIVSVGGITYIQTTTAVEENVNDELETTANLEGNSIGQWINQLRSNTQAASDNPRLETTSDATRLQQVLVTEALRYPSVEAIHLVNTTENTVVASSASFQASLDIENRKLTTIDQPWAGALSEGIQYRDDDATEIGETTYIDRSISEEPLLWLSSQVVGSDGREIVLLANVEDFVTTGTRQGHDVRVLREDPNQLETVLAVEDGVLNSTAVARSGMFNETAARATFRDGETRTTQDSELVQSYSAVDAVNWGVVVTMDVDQAFSVRNTVGRNVLVLVTLALLSLGIVGVLLGRSTIPPLVTLRQKAARISEGDFDVDLETDRIDEIGALYDEFSDMRWDLQSRISELRQSRQEAEEINEQLRVLDRVLRHNLNNKMNVVTIEAEFIRDETSGTPADSAQQIIDISDNLLTKAEKQRKITRLLAEDTERHQTDIEPMLEKITDSVSEQYPDVELDVTVDSSVTVHSTHFLEDAITEIVENAIIHNDQSEQRVEIHVTREGTEVEIAIADNGPGIPEMDREVLTDSQTIDPLSHGSGIGLWFVFWTVRRAGGEIFFEENEPRGSTLCLRLVGDSAAGTVTQSGVGSET